MEGTSKFMCTKCNARFQDSAHLRRHAQRKTPCAPIIDRADLPANKQASPNACRYCGRTYTRADSVTRHLKTCTIANSDAGMEKLYEHTIKQQQTRIRELEQQVAEQERKCAQLISADLAAKHTEQMPVPAIVGTLVQNTGPVTNVTNHIQVNVMNFDSDNRIRIPVSLVKAAFTENPRLMEYRQMDDDARTNAEKAAPYVLEALIDLIRRAHKDPIYRNIYLSPKRADQVMVFVAEPPLCGVDDASGAPEPRQSLRSKEGEARSSKEERKQRWEVRSLVDAIRLLFDGVADNLHKIVVTDQDRTQLPLDIQSAASWVPNLYEDEPDKFVKEGKVPMTAHLQNNASAHTASLELRAPRATATPPWSGGAARALEREKPSAPLALIP